MNPSTTLAPAEALSATGVRVLQGGAVVTGVVGAFRVYIQRRGAEVHSECSCAQPPPCVHAAEVLRSAESVDAGMQEGRPERRTVAALAIDSAFQRSAQRQRLYYRLDAAGPDTGSGFSVSILVGGPGEAHPFLLPLGVDLERRDTAPRYIDDEDRQILRQLTGFGSGPWVLQGVGAAAVLEHIVSTGRAYWQALRGAPLTLADLRPTSTVPRDPVQRQPPSTLTGRLMISRDAITTVHFVYNGISVDSRHLRFGSLSGSVDAVEGIERDHARECALQGRLNTLMPSAPQSRPEWLTFMLEAVPALQAEGWEVCVDEGFPYRIATAERWYADLRADRATRGEWFDLKLGLTVDGHEVNLLPALVSYLQGTLEDDKDLQRIGDRLAVRLKDGRYLPLPIERIERIADTLVELFERDALSASEGLPMTASQAGRLAHLARDLADAPMVRSNDDTLAALLDDLQGFSPITPLQAPGGFPAALRPYQQEGLGWLQFLRRHRLGGILADDMGLGKTIQTLAHLMLEKAELRLRQPALIVAPVSVIGNWRRELERIGPALTFLVLHGPKRHDLFSRMGGVDVIVTGYPQLQLDAQALQAQAFSFVILDEAQTIKNPHAKVSQAARALRADHRLCLTGTPMENHLGDLWSLFQFAQPGLLGGASEFQRQYRAPIEKQDDKARAEALTRRIAPFLLRRTKDAVASDLPAKTQIVESILMDEQQRELYDSIRLAMHRRIREAIEDKGLARSHVTVLDALLKLRQVCCDPRLIDAGSAIASAKMAWLTTVLPELVAEGRRILLFSQFTSMLALIEAALAPLSIPYLLLTGATRERQTLVERFQAGEAPLFLISLKAGGTGLNLTAADTVIHYDPWWNPAAEAQATDRAHRIGQDKPVFVHKLSCQGTVEEKILTLQADKQALAGRLYSERSASPGTLTAEDLDRLFAP